MEEAMRADVLFLGNSRILCAINNDALSRYSEESGDACFNLGFGYDEGSSFALGLIEKYDLRPRIAVVNCDVSFWGSPSIVAGDVMSKNGLKVRAEVVEFKAAWKLRRLIHQWVPKLVAPENIAIWRGRETGAWIVRFNEKKESAVSYMTEEPDRDLMAKLMHSVSQFQKALSSRDTKLVLTLVPSDHSNVTIVKRIARALGISTLLVSDDDLLTTFDGDHLDHGSSQVFAESILMQLLELDQ